MLGSQQNEIQLWKGALVPLHEFDTENSTLIGCGGMSVILRTQYTGSTIPSRTGKYFALKALEKARMLRNTGSVQRLNNEKRALQQLSEKTPGVCTMYTTLQSDCFVYFVLKLGEYGDLMQHYRRMVGTPFPLETAKILIAQIVSTLECMHEQGIVHRDIKLENICFRENNFSIMIVDYEHVDITEGGHKVEPVSNGGNPLPNSRQSTRSRDDSEDSDDEVRVSAAEVQNMRKKSQAFCGSVQTVSPEMLGAAEWSYASDLWALGVVAYTLLVGVEPFGDPTTPMMDSFRAVIAGRYLPIPSGVVTPEALDLIQRLLVIDPTLRLGTTHMGGYAELKRHPFFLGVNWDVETLWSHGPLDFGERGSPQLNAQYVDYIHNNGTEELTQERLKEIFKSAT